MPSVTVILDGGHEVHVEGANSAEWSRDALVSDYKSGPARAAFVV